MITVEHTDIYDLREYANHLKNLTKEDKRSRFGIDLSDSSIDHLILSMVYSPKDHELWIAKSTNTGEILGFGHLARDHDSAWELAVSVNKDHQRKGVGDALMTEMISWAKFHKVTEIYMHCIEENKVIQHLSSKHNLQVRSRSFGEQTSSIEVPSPNVFEHNTQLWKEFLSIYGEVNSLQEKMTKLWLNRRN
jgi:GNAT superfamily N-acetyltransferase